MKFLFLVSLFLLGSCNVMQAITDGDTDLDQDFFDTNHCDDVCQGLYNSLHSFYNFNNYSSGYSDSFGGDFLSEVGTPSGFITSGYRGSAINCSAIGVADFHSNTNMSFPFGMTIDFTISFWVKRGAQSSPHGYIFHMITGGGNILARQSTGSDDLEVVIGGASPLVDSSFFNNTTWNHFAVRVDRDTGISICRNGGCQPYDGQNTTGDNFSPTITLKMCTDTTDAGWDGQVDSLGFWTRALSNQEIAALASGNDQLN